jgi:hypothetical protein
MANFAYYEDGNAKIFSMQEVHCLFCDLVGQDQKNNGTTFETWLDEMERMQILNRL